jgi:uncharacterized protein (DUF1501 family)
MHSRRDFLKQASLVALAPVVPSFLAHTARAAMPDRDGRILVILELGGGNDGINTVVPFADEGYAKCRKELRLPKDRLVKVNDSIGLHPAMTEAGQLLESNRLAIVQAVGYPNPNRSHFSSLAIWSSARLDRDERNGLGWIGRGLDEGPKPHGGAPAAVFVGKGQMPPALRSRRSVASGLTRLEDFILAPEVKPGPLLLPSPPGEEGNKRGLGAEPKDDLLAFVRRSTLDGYASAGRMAEVIRMADRGGQYPQTKLGSQLGLIARLIKADVGTRVYYAIQASYDTHAGQAGTHFGLLRELSGALKAFLDDLATAKLAERVTVLVFSEFGRTVQENGAFGTDHGTAGPVFLAGPCIKAGIVGTMPRLLDPDPKHGDLRVGIDFRRVYATVLEKWLGLPSREALGGAFEPLPLFRG